MGGHVAAIVTGVILAAFGAAGVSDATNPVTWIAIGVGATVAQVGIIAAGVRWGTADVGGRPGPPPEQSPNAAAGPVRPRA